MFSRVTKVIHISTLPREHLIPFAIAYLDHAKSMFLADKSASRGKEIEGFDLEIRLKVDFGALESRISPWGRRENDGSVVARAWLDALREWADDLVG